jgi:phosphatidylinositol alpha-1,6-mannosyltransferase
MEKTKTMTMEERAASRSVSSRPWTLARSPLVLSEIFPPTRGGSGKWLSEIYARMDSVSGVMVVGTTPHASSDFDDQRYPKPVLREDLSMAFRGLANASSLFSYARIIRRVSQLVRLHRATEIHAARPLFEGLVARWIQWRLGIPYLCFVHGEDINVAMTSRELSLLTASVLNHAEKLVANSSFTQNLLLSDWRIPRDRIEMMHPGVDCQYFQPLPTSTPRQLFPEDRRVLLTVGRLQERKGHDTLLMGLPSIREKVPDVLYAIAGDGEQRPKLQGLVEKLNLQEQVRFLGEIDDSTLRQCYRECDLFVLPNRSVGRDVEGFGIVLLEAQACGKPVIAGRSGGTEDAMAHGKTGRLVDCQNPENPGELVAAICEILDDAVRREVMGGAARTFVRNNFDWPILARRAERALYLPTR